MIIKSMARKDRSFRQLVFYMAHNHPAKDRFVWNCYQDGDDLEALSEEFFQNSQLLKDVKGANFLYHEIIALNPIEKIGQKNIKAILLDLGEQYLAQRAKTNLAFGTIHMEKNHPHLHLMISANGGGERKRTRLSKSDFSKIQKDMEFYQWQTYPRLGTRHIYTGEKKERAKALNSQVKQSKKNEIKAILTMALGSLNEEGFLSCLREAKLSLYSRGKQKGILASSGRKYRLKTFGMDQNYKEAEERWRHQQKRLQKIMEVKQTQQQSFIKNQDDELCRGSFPKTDQKEQGVSWNSDPASGIEQNEAW